MKSIMQEASSVSKAIEMGWTKAGQPKEFSVKIFEEPQKNFFGITTRSAKIGIFFEEDKPQKTETSKPRQASQNRPQDTRQQAPRTQESRSQNPKITEKPTQEKKPLATSSQQEKPNKASVEAHWSNEMQDSVKQWLTKTLKTINSENSNYVIESENFRLLIKFDKPLFTEELRQKQFFSSLSNLFLQMLKRQYRRPLKGYKIILQS